MDAERNYVGWAVGIAAVIAAAAIGYYFWQSQAVKVPPPLAQSEAPASAPVSPPEPQIQHPLQVSGEPLPPLEQSDSLLQESLAQLLGSKNLSELFFIDRIVTRIVATVDNLPREKVATRIMAAKPVAGSFVIDRQGDEMALGAGNSARYARHVQLLESVDVKRAVALYVRLYPLFQRAYTELGYPKGYFNDRLVEVIDHLLATPEVRGPIKLTQPKVRYQFADPAFESLSAGRKIMLRIGADNAARVKGTLQELRRELIEQAPKK